MNLSAINKFQSKNDEPITSKRRTNALPPPPIDIIMDILQLTACTIEWLAGDGSDRCYYRIFTGPNCFPRSYVLMQLSGTDAKALKENGYDWVQIAKILHDNSIPTPYLVKTLPDYAALIIEDYGNIMLESKLLELWKQKNFQDIKTLFLRCFKLINIMLKIPNDPTATWCRRAFDKDRFIWELNFFYNHFIEAALNIKLSNKQKDLFNNESYNLAEFLSSYSKYFVHRDFHSRNIMYKSAGESGREDAIALIDFQDARLGPCSYDFVSIIFDNYLPFSSDFRMELLNIGLDYLGENIKNKDIINDIKINWRPMLLQRQLKAIGSYGYLTIAKARGDYLKYVPEALLTLKFTEDQRWPFLSTDLPSLIMDAVNEQ